METIAEIAEYAAKKRVEVYGKILRGVEGVREMKRIAKERFGGSFGMYGASEDSFACGFERISKTHQVLMAFRREDRWTFIIKPYTPEYII